MSKINQKHIGAVLALALSLPAITLAAPVYDEFGPFPDATWGGSGIPNDAVAASTQLYDGTTSIRVAMSATQRYSNPAPTNNAAGTYFAQTGSNFGGAGQSTTEGALWNFNFFVEILDPNDASIGIADYDVKLFYDFDPGFNTAKNELGVIDIDAGVAGSSNPGATLSEDSQNLMFGFLGTTIPGFITAPAIGAFDPDAIGEYHFAIEVAKNGWNVEAVAIDVQTVPVPAAVWLFGSGLLGMIAVARRRRA